jgi:hypothetical protein
MEFWQLSQRHAKTDIFTTGCWVIDHANQKQIQQPLMPVVLTQNTGARGLTQIVIAGALFKFSRKPQKVSNAFWGKNMAPSFKEISTIETASRRDRMTK